MKKTSTFISCTAALAVAFSASAVDAPSFVWGNFFDGNGTTSGDNNIAVTVGSDNSIYWLNTLGSTDAVRDLYFGDTELFTGSAYTGTSVNNNFALTKTNPQGEVLWTVYTNSGDFASAQGSVVENPDGSLIFSAKARLTDGHFDTPVTFVDATGASTEVGSTSTDGKRHYFVVLGKVSADGQLLWTRTIDPATTLSDEDETTTLTDIVTCAALSVVDDNIFVGGSFSRQLYFEKADGSVASISSISSADWEASGSERDLYIAKFDADGYFIDAITNSGNPVTTLNVLSFTTKDSTLYFQGVSKEASDDATTATLGDKTIYTGALNSAFIGALNPETLAVDWITSLTNEGVDGKGDYQNSSLTVCGDHLWLAGMANGTFTASNNADLKIATVTGNIREGLLAKISTNGDVLAATTSRAGFPDITLLTGYLNAYENESMPGKVYVYGYIMNATYGVFLRAYDAETLASDSSASWTLLTQGGVPTGGTIAYNASEPSAYITARGNKAFVADGDITSATPNSWAVYAARFDLPDQFLSGIAVTETPAADMAVSAVAGGLVATAATPTTLAVYDIAGRCVASVAVNGQTFIALPAGLYLANGAKFAIH